jgi:diguanylate cyclase (GGDEF)-like protein
MRCKVSLGKLNRWASLLLGTLFLLGLYLTTFYNYLLFHSLVEIFSIVVGFSIFILAWNSRFHLDDYYLLFLGVAYLSISLVDLLHTLAYKGMGVFPGFGTNLPTQLWIAGRYIQAFSFLIAFLFFQRRWNIYMVVGGYAVVTFLLLAAIFSGIFPACYVEGIGLTAFKKVSEYIISLLFLISIILVLRRRAAFDRNVLRWLVTSLLLTIGAELSFTLYANVFGLANLVGHLFKLVAFFMVYQAILMTGLEKPQRLLFRKLKVNEVELRRAFEKQQHLAAIDSLTGLYNRRQFFKLAEDELQDAHRFQRSLSTIVIDVDHFKHVNDTYGHLIGDQVLQSVAERFRQGLREIDLLCRYGGDEFAALLPDLDSDTAYRVAERLREGIAQSPLPTKVGEVPVTISLGISSLQEVHSSLEALLDQSDRALYSAKQNGRNQVCRA